MTKLIMLISNRGSRQDQEENICNEGGSPIPHQDLLLRAAGNSDRTQICTGQLQERHQRYVGTTSMK